MRFLETWIHRISLVAISIVLLAMMLQVVIDVAMRSFLGAGFPATADLVARYYMVTISLMPLAMTEIGRRHIEATIFTDKLKGRARTAIYAIGFLIGITVFSMLAWGTTQEALRQTARKAYVEAGALYFVTWPSYWIPAIAFGLMVLVLAIRLVELATGTFEDSDHDPLEQVEHAKAEAK